MSKTDNSEQQSPGTAESVSGAAVQDDRAKMAASALEDVIVTQDSYGIRLTDTAEGRSSASLLINKMYAWRGYAGTHQVVDDPNRITLTATDHGKVVGTLTIGMDAPVGLAADQIFKEELDQMRERGGRLCEFTKLAFDPSVKSKASLANLFHLAVIYARDIHHRTDIVIEVNPRHRRFYQQMLGFEQLGDMKTSPRVNAPAYLLRVGLDFVTEQIKQFGGTCNEQNSGRSFYPWFFSPREEEGIIHRLQRIDEQHLA
jgi:hypothetical protein